MAKGFTAEHVNDYTGDWSATYEKVHFIDRELDPWISASVLSDHRPGGPLKQIADGDLYYLIVLLCAPVQS